MAIHSFNNIPERYQGIIYIIFGVIILLYALGFIEKGISLIIVGLALYAIFIGCNKLGLTKYVSKIKNKIEK